MKKKTAGEKGNSVLNFAWSNKNTELTEELTNARPADISHRNEITKKKLLKTALNGAVRYAAMLACFLVFLGASGYVASYAIQYMEKKQQNSQISELAESIVDSRMAERSQQSAGNAANAVLGQSMDDFVIDIPVENNDTYNEYFEQKRAPVVGLQRMYPDVYGWIDVPGTGIDYIVMQGRDNKDYLYADYDGSYTRYGSIFADCRNSRNIQRNRNTVIYGHNMNTARIMFAPLLDFVTDEAAFRNQIINVITPDGLYTYELFSIYDTYASYNYIQTDFESDEEFIDFCNACRNKSIYKKDITFTKDSKLLTLSTCTVRGDGMRWALHAVLISVSN